MVIRAGSRGSPYVDWGGGESTPNFNESVLMKLKKVCRSLYGVWGGEGEGLRQLIIVF